MKEINRPDFYRSVFNRNRLDKYYTEPWVTDIVVPEIKRTLGEANRIWEPTGGGCHMADALCKHDFELMVTDMDPKDFTEEWAGWGNESIDFLKDDILEDYEVDAIVFNPPYALQASKFIKRALHLMDKHDSVELVAALVRSGFKHGKSRNDIFRDCPEYACEVVVQGRPRWDEWWTGVKMKNGGMHDYSWHIWKKGYNDLPVQRFGARPKGKINYIDYDVWR